MLLSVKKRFKPLTNRGYCSIFVFSLGKDAILHRKRYLLERKINAGNAIEMPRILK